MKSFSHLPKGFTLSIMVDGKLVGSFKNLGGQSIASAVSHAPQGSLVIHKGCFRDSLRELRSGNVEGIGWVLLDKEAASFEAETLPENGFLVERDMGVGDLVMLVPVLRRLHDMGYYVCLVCAPSFMPLFTNHPKIDKVGDIDDRPWPVSPNVIDVRWKVDFPGGHRWYTTHHRTVIFAQIFMDEQGLDVTPNDMKPDLYLPPETEAWAEQNAPKGPFAVVQMRASSHARSYLKMDEVCEKLMRRGIQVVAVHHQPHPVPEGAVDLCGGREPIERIAAIIERASVVVTPDSASLHIAGAFDVPTVALFGPFDPRLRTAYYPNCQALRARPECPFCWENDPCAWQGGPCLGEIPVDDVVGKAMEIAR